MRKLTTIGKQTITIILIIVLINIGLQSTFAQDDIGGTIIPNTDYKQTECEDVFRNSTDEILEGWVEDRNNGAKILGCAVKVGRVKLWMIPYFIRYLAEFLISLAGIVCLFFIVLGGYYYLFGGLGQDQDKGKKTILYACIGLIVVSLAWIIVNIVLYAVSQ